MRHCFSSDWVNVASKEFILRDSILLRYFVFRSLSTLSCSLKVRRQTTAGILQTITTTLTNFCSCSSSTSAACHLDICPLFTSSQFIPWRGQAIQFIRVAQGVCRCRGNLEGRIWRGINLLGQFFRGPRFNYLEEDALEKSSNALS